MGFCQYIFMLTVCGVFFMTVYVLQARSTLRAGGFSYSSTFNIIAKHVDIDIFARDTKCVSALLLTYFYCYCVIANLDKLSCRT